MKYRIIQIIPAGITQHAVYAYNPMEKNQTIKRRSVICWALCDMLDPSSPTGDAVLNRAVHGMVADADELILAPELDMTDGEFMGYSH